MPSFWLVLVALVAAVNPFRTAMAVPRSGRSRREVGEIALLGGLVAGVGVLVVAGLSGPLLDALDVSGPAIRLAAGIVAGVAGLVAVFRRPPAAEPALPGRGAALVPVAVPLVATPALLLLAMSAHSDRGLPVLVAGLVLAVALLAVLAGSGLAGAAGSEDRHASASGPADAPTVDADDGVEGTTAADVVVAETTDDATPAGVAPRVFLWAGRLTAAALVAACVALVVDGVLAV
jgi:small neutral amino acid transporter SnatA (MarC family)